MKISLFNIAVLVSISTVTLVACTTNTQKENTTAGAVAGAVLGGIAGSTIGAGTGQFVATGVGAVAGALLGGAIGQNMESSDNTKMNNTLDHNAVRKTSKWTNKSNNAKYTMTPMSHVMNYKGHYPCRRYYSTVTMEGKKQVVNGVACRNEEGNWQAMG